MIKVAMFVLSAAFLTTGLAEAKTIRATELAGSTLAQLKAATAEELIIEFRQGDELPVSFTAEGDLLETSRAGVSYVAVKRNFWLKVKNDSLEMSLEGASYRPVQEVLSGSLTAGAGSEENGGVANAINLGLKAILK